MGTTERGRPAIIRLPSNRTFGGMTLDQLDRRRLDCVALFSSQCDDVINRLPRPARTGVRSLGTSASFLLRGAECFFGGRSLLRLFTIAQVSAGGLAASGPYCRLRFSLLSHWACRWLPSPGHVAASASVPVAMAVSKAPRGGPRASSCRVNPICLKRRVAMTRMVVPVGPSRARAPSACVTRRRPAAVQGNEPVAMAISNSPAIRRVCSWRVKRAWCKFPGAVVQEIRPVAFAAAEA